MTRSTHSRPYRALVDILAEARRRSGLTQKQVADRLGKPQSYIAKVEAAERRVDPVEFARLANALGADPLGLFQDLLKSAEVSEILKDYRTSEP